MAEVQPQQQGVATRENAPANGAHGQQTASNEEPYRSQYANAGLVGQTPSPARRPCDPCCGCCGSLRDSVIVWDIFFWLNWPILLLRLWVKIFIHIAELERLKLPVPTFCAIGGRLCGVAQVMAYFFAVTILTIAIFASSLTPQTRIQLTRVFYLLLIPIYCLFGITGIITSFFEQCYSTLWHNDDTGLYAMIASELIIWLVELLIAHRVGRANIYCIQEETVAYNGIEQRSSESG